MLKGDNDQRPRSFSPDGKRLAFHRLDDQNRSSDLWTVPITSDSRGIRAGQPEPYLQGPADEVEPEFSPDGRWMAYASDETGEYQVFVRAFPDKGARWQVSSSSGLQPVWSRTAPELFFRTEDQQIMVVTYKVHGDTFTPDKPRLWTEKRLAPRGRARNFDLHPDGKRVVALTNIVSPGAQEKRSHVIFVENFLDELRRRTESH